MEAYPMATQPIEVLDAAVRVMDLEIPSKNVADFLRNTPTDQRPSAFIRAVEVGVFSLERAQTEQNTQLLQLQVKTLLSDFEKAVADIGAKTKETILAQIGTSDGQALAPVRIVIDEATKAINQRIGDVRSMVEQHIDPSKQDSTLGMALGQIKAMLDPERSGSVQNTLDAAIAGIAAEDGTLSARVKKVVGETVDPLIKEVQQLREHIVGKEAADAALRQTTAKGVSYEEQVVGRLQAWGRNLGAEVEYVGGDHLPGDVVIRLAESSMAGTPITIAVEVKDETTAQRGRKQITDALERARAQRGANGAIFVNRTGEGLAKEIGDWAEGVVGGEPWVATTDEHLLIAVRHLIARRQLMAARELRPDIDTGVVRDNLNAIKTALRRIGNINKTVTELRGNANAVEAEATGLREDINQALDAIETATRIAVQEQIAG